MTPARGGAPLPGRLMIVVDLDYAGDESRCFEMLRASAQAAEGRSVALQLRAHSLSRAGLGAFAARARAEVPSTVPMLLNGPPALAAALEFDGAHTPEADIPDGRPDVALRWLSSAVHGLDGVRRAERAHADLAVFGSVYEPGSHEGAAAGLDALRDVAGASSIPVIAIGGITPERVAACVAAGAAGVAVISGILGTPDIERAVIEYCDALEAAT